MSHMKISAYEHRDHVKLANGEEFVLCWHIGGTTWMDFAGYPERTA